MSEVIVSVLTYFLAGFAVGYVIMRLLRGVK